VTWFEVVINDGPAKDWSYGTTIEPDYRIHVAPFASYARVVAPFASYARVAPVKPARHGRQWMRVLEPEPDVPPWPGQCVYKRAMAKSMADADTIVYSYDLERELT
jgi:hypothetical protein